jgi:hypothetical protein
MLKILPIALALLLAPTAANAIQLFDNRLEWENALGSTNLSNSINDDFSEEIPQDEILDLASGILSINSRPALFDDNSVYGGFYYNAVSDEDRATSDAVIWQFPFQIQAFGVDFYDGFDTQDTDSLAIYSDFGGDRFALLFDNSKPFLGFILEPQERTDYLTFFVNDVGWDVFRLDNVSFLGNVEIPGVFEPSMLLGLLCVGFYLPLKGYKDKSEKPR